MKMAVFWDVEPRSLIDTAFTDISKVLTASIIRVMNKPCAERLW
jgi:hypothetical protein